MCGVLIFNTQKRYEKQKNWGNFSATFWKFRNFLKKIATFRHFYRQHFGIHRQLVAKPTRDGSKYLELSFQASA